MMSDHLRRSRLQLLGHVARLPADHVPKQLLFGWLPETRPAHGPRMRWKDRVTSDLRALAVTNWYSLAQDRQAWRAVTRTLPEPLMAVPLVLWDVCHRQFKSASSLARRKCAAVRRLPVAEQPGAQQCSACHRWFRSAGGLAVHVCSSHRQPSTLVPQDHSQPEERIPASGMGFCSFHCATCFRRFRSTSVFKCHNCKHGHHTSVDRSGYAHACSNCEHRFRRSQDLQRHKCKLY